MKDINEMTRKEFEELPSREDWSEDVYADCLVILPKRRLHDSGYRCLDYVAVSKERMIRVAGCSDVMHIDGIGGFGDDWMNKYGTCPKAVHPIGWSVDCLKVSGLLRIFAHAYKIKCGPALSSFEMFAIPTANEMQWRQKFE